MVLYHVYSLQILDETKTMYHMPLITLFDYLLILKLCLRVLLPHVSNIICFEESFLRCTGWHVSVYMNDMIDIKTKILSIYYKTVWNLDF